MRMAVVAVTLAALAACSIERPPVGSVVRIGETPVVPEPFQDYIGAGDDIDPLDDAERLD